MCAGGACATACNWPRRLADLNLVNRRGPEGFLLEQCNLYRAPACEGAHLYGIRIRAAA